MRTVTILSSLAIATSVTACAQQPTDPQTSEETSALDGTLTSTAWVAGVNQETEVWPAGQGIQSMVAVYRKGPQGCATGATHDDCWNYTNESQYAYNTIVATVTWNDTTMGRIYRCRVGADCQSMRAAIADIGAVRAYNADPFLKYTFGVGGNGNTGGPMPLPHPNVAEVPTPVTISSALAKDVNADASRIHADIDAANEE